MMKPYVFMFVSDIHLGAELMNVDKLSNSFNGKTNQYEGLVADLKRIYYKEKVDQVIFLGDTLDKPLSVDSTNYTPVKDILRDLMSEFLPSIFLKGTSSHDGIYQIPNLKREFELENYLADPERMCDQYEVSPYVDKITVSVIKMGIGKGRRTFHMGFIPDNMGTNKEEIIASLKKEMEIKKVNELDYLFTHVLWDFHVDPKRLESDVPVFKVSDFPFVKKHIVTGHIHQHQIRGKLIVCGSCTRTRYEEEDEKGVVIVRDYGDKTEVVRIPLKPLYQTYVFYPTEPLEDIENKILSSGEYTQDDILTFPIPKPGNIAYLSMTTDIFNLVMSLIAKGYKARTPYISSHLLNDDLLKLYQEK